MCIYVYYYKHMYKYEAHTINFHILFVWALSLIVHI